MAVILPRNTDAMRKRMLPSGGDMTEQRLNVEWQIGARVDGKPAQERVARRIPDRVTRRQMGHAFAGVTRAGASIDSQPQSDRPVAPTTAKADSRTPRASTARGAPGKAKATTAEGKFRISDLRFQIEETAKANADPSPLKGIRDDSGGIFRLQGIWDDGGGAFFSDVE